MACRRLAVLIEVFIKVCCVSRMGPTKTAICCVYSSDVYESIAASISMGAGVGLAIACSLDTEVWDV